MKPGHAAPAPGRAVRVRVRVRVRLRDVTKQDLDALCRVLWGEQGHASTAEFLLAGPA